MQSESFAESWGAGGRHGEVKIPAVYATRLGRGRLTGQCEGNRNFPSALRAFCQGLTSRKQKPKQAKMADNLVGFAEHEPLVALGAANLYVTRPGLSSDEVRRRIPAGVHDVVPLKSSSRWGDPSGRALLSGGESKVQYRPARSRRCSRLRNQARCGLVVPSSRSHPLRTSSD